jgi:hypothetical protein
MIRSQKIKNSLRLKINSSERKKLKTIYSEINLKRKYLSWIKTDEQ